MNNPCRENEVGYQGSRHFEAHAYRTEDFVGVKDFPRGCMRTYLILKEKAARFKIDKEIQALLAGAGVGAWQDIDAAFEQSVPVTGRQPGKPVRSGVSILPGLVSGSQAYLHCTGMKAAINPMDTSAACRRPGGTGLSTGSFLRIR